MTSRKQNIIAVLILTVGVIAAYLILGPGEGIVLDNQEENKESASTAVEVIELSNQGTFNLEKSVTFESTGTAGVIAEYAGRIESVNFEVGDQVREGQILAAFEQSIDKNSAKASFESAKKSLEIAEDNYEKTKEIADESVEIAESQVDLAEIQYEQSKEGGSESAIETAEENLEIAKDGEDQAEASAETQINGAELQLEQSRLQFQQAKIQYEKTFIQAPVSGTVTSKNLAANDYLSAGRQVGEIIGKGSVFAKVYLNSKEIQFITGNEKVVLSDGGQRLDAQIESFSKTPNASNQRFEVLLEANEGLKQLANNNMEASIEITTETNGNGFFFIPLSAVNIGQTRNQVFAAKNGIAHSVEVEVEEIIGEQAKISGEIESGDLLVVEGNRNLQDGEKIDIANNQQSTIDNQ